MSTKNPKIITTSADLDAHLLKVNKAANSLNAGIQLALASSVFQAVAHGNTNFINVTIKVAGKGVRKTAMAQWLLKHAPVVAETDREKAKEQPFRFSRDKLAELMPDADPKAVTLEESELYAQGLMEFDWTEHKEPPLVPESWSALDALKKLVQTAKSMQTKNVKVEHAELLSQIEVLLPAKDAEPLAL